MYQPSTGRRGRADRRGHGGRDTGAQGNARHGGAPLLLCGRKGDQSTSGCLRSGRRGDPGGAPVAIRAVVESEARRRALVCLLADAADQQASNHLYPTPRHAADRLRAQGWGRVNAPANGQVVDADRDFLIRRLLPGGRPRRVATGGPAGSDQVCRRVWSNSAAVLPRRLTSGVARVGLNRTASRRLGGRVCLGMIRTACRSHCCSARRRSENALQDTDARQRPCRCDLAMAARPAKLGVGDSSGGPGPINWRSCQVGATRCASWRFPDRRLQTCRRR